MVPKYTITFFFASWSREHGLVSYLTAILAQFYKKDAREANRIRFKYLRTFAVFTALFTRVRLGEFEAFMRNAQEFSHPYPVPECLGKAMQTRKKVLYCSYKISLKNSVYLHSSKHIYLTSERTTLNMLLVFVLKFKLPFFFIWRLFTYFNLTWMCLGFPVKSQTSPPL